MRLRNISYYLGKAQIVRKLRRAESALAIFNMLERQGYPASFKEVEEDGGPLVIQLMIREAALSAAIVACYSLIDDNESVTLNNLLEKSAEIEPGTGKPYVSAALRDKLELKLNGLTSLRRKVLQKFRNMEIAHTSNDYAPHLRYEEEREVEKHLEPIYSGCMEIINEIQIERGLEPFPQEYDLLCSEHIVEIVRKQE